MAGPRPPLLLLLLMAGPRPPLLLLLLMAGPRPPLLLLWLMAGPRLLFAVVAADARAPQRRCCC
eukprot:gene51544-15686_t